MIESANQYCPAGLLPGRISVFATVLRLGVEPPGFMSEGKGGEYMRVFKREKCWYVDYRVNGRRVKKSFGRQKATAELFLKDVELKLARGQLEIVDESAKWSEFLDRYLQYAKVTKSPSTVSKDLSRLKVITEFLNKRGIIKLKQIDCLLLEEFKAQVLETCSPKTFNHHLDLLRTILNRAVEWKCLRSNPLASFRRLKNSRGRQMRFLNTEEIRQVLEAADPFMSRVIMLLLNTGLRKSELVYLEWKDIDFENRILTVQAKPEFGFHPKSYKRRHIPINSALEKLLLDLPQNGRFVFDNGKNRPLHHPDFYYKNLMRIYKKENIQEANLHTLRHTFASHLVMSGVDIRTVQELMGHSSIAITENYSHLSPVHITRAVEMLKFDRPVGTNKEQNPHSPS